MVRSTPARRALAFVPFVNGLVVASGCVTPDREWELTRGALREQLESQAAAWNRGDLDAFMVPYWKSDKLTFSAGGETQRGWQATYDRFRRRYPTRDKMGRLSFSDLEIEPLGGRRDAALVLGRWRVERSEGPLGGNFSLVFEDIPGTGWRIVHDHTSQSAPSPR